MGLRFIFDSFHVSRTIVSRLLWQVTTDYVGRSAQQRSPEAFLFVQDSHDAVLASQWCPFDAPFRGQAPGDACHRLSRLATGVASRHAESTTFEV